MLLKSAILFSVGVISAAVVLKLLFRKRKVLNNNVESTFHSSTFVPYVSDFDYSNQREVLNRFHTVMRNRRSVRDFDSARPVDEALINACLFEALQSPSGANQQPWTYVVVQDMNMKQQVREIVEREEKINYETRMSSRWKSDLKPLGTTWQKEYLTDAPVLILLFKQVYGVEKNGDRSPHYYVELSTAISCGFFLCAITHAGLVSCTTTPMNAGPKLANLFDRPKNEKCILLLPVGYPKATARVPAISKRPMERSVVWF